MRLLIFILFILLSITGFSQENPKLDFDQIVFDSTNLPISFDLRSSTILSPVRVQPNGGCWASASNVTAESWFRTNGIGDFLFSDINLQLCNGFAEERKAYGNHLMATAYYSRGSGPLKKNMDTDSLNFVSAPFPYRLSDARFLPNDPSIIKQTLMDFGPVYSMLYFKRIETDTISHIYYTDVTKINHVVSLVGWNDTLATKKGRGVWVAQNSLGRNYGEGGFFYIPYQDKNILQHNAIWTNWLANGSDYNIYYNDTLGATNEYGFDDTVCAGLLEFTAQNDGRLEKVATWIRADQTSITIEVFQNFDKEKKTLIKPLVSDLKKLCKFSGYYTFDIPKPIHFTEGESFYIVIQYSNPNVNKPLPVEQFIKKYSDPHITSGKCWINPDPEKWPDTWYEVGLNSDYDFLSFDLSIRAYFFND